MFRDGRYHLFYLHDSWAAAGPSKRSDGYNYKAWAHVSSADLVHWQRHPDAIARGQTGNLFDWNGTPAIVFPHPDGGGAGRRAAGAAPRAARVVGRGAGGRCGQRCRRG